MAMEFTCLSCTRTFSILVCDISRLDYLSCVGCGRPVPVDLLDALKIVGESITFDTDSRKNKSLWYVRFKERRWVTEKE